MEKEQNLFNEILQFVLEVISSEDYLNNNNIYRSKPINPSNWENFKSKFLKGKLKAGIYPRKFAGNEVHYFAVRNEKNNEQTIANGYKNRAGIKKNSFGLDVQPNNSHGLCQTFALMYYFGDENKLKKGEQGYFENVLIGLNYLNNFINKNKKRELCWEKKDILFYIQNLYENINDKDRCEYLKYISSKKLICLTDLINFLKHKKNNIFLKNWFNYEINN